MFAGTFRLGFRIHTKELKMRVEIFNSEDHDVNFKCTGNGEFECYREYECRHEGEYDQDGSQFNYDDAVEYVEEILFSRKLPKYGWHMSSDNIGWQGRSGFKLFVASSGPRFIENVIPDYDNHTTIWKIGGGFEVSQSSHDRTMGTTFYIRHATKDEMEAHYYGL